MRRISLVIALTLIAQPGSESGAQMVQGRVSGNNVTLYGTGSDGYPTTTFGRVSGNNVTLYGIGSDGYPTTTFGRVSGNNVTLYGTGSDGYPTTTFGRVSGNNVTLYGTGAGWQGNTPSQNYGSRPNNDIGFGSVEFGGAFTRRKSGGYQIGSSPFGNSPFRSIYHDP